ncbi:MAG: hypothetical protein AAF587_33080 [Bacteroidota bacterium]
MRKSEMSNSLLKQRQKVISTFEKLGWEAEDINQLFDEGEDVEYEAVFSMEEGENYKTCEFNAERQELTLVVNQDEIYESYIFSYEAKLSIVLSLFEEYLPNLKRNNLRTLIDRCLEVEMDIFKEGDHEFLPVLTKQEIEDTRFNIKDFIENNDWMLVNRTTIYPINVKIKEWDLGARFNNNNFYLYIDISIEKYCIRFHMYDMEDKLFSDLYIYSSEIFNVLELIERWKPDLDKEGYSRMVKEIIDLSSRVIFDDNGKKLLLS